VVVVVCGRAPRRLLLLLGRELDRLFLLLLLLLLLTVQVLLLLMMILSYDIVMLLLVDNDSILEGEGGSCCCVTRNDGFVVPVLVYDHQPTIDIGSGTMIGRRGGGWIFESKIHSNDVSHHHSASRVERETLAGMRSWELA
jgi:hypothetical protein